MQERNRFSYFLGLHKHWKRAQEAYPMVASKEERETKYLGVATELRPLKRCSFSYSWDAFCSCCGGVPHPFALGAAPLLGFHDFQLLRFHRSDGLQYFSV